MSEPWHPGETVEEQARRREAYERLLSAARRVGMPAQQLAGLLRQVAQNETQTRRFLTEQVYGVPDDLLDDLIRIRLSELPDATQE